MNIQQALNIFGLSGELTEQDVKKAYKQAALKFHPDKNRENPTAAEMMKAINTAYDFLIQNIDRINEAQSSDDRRTGKRAQCFTGYVWCDFRGGR
nr:J domain-containing protein [Klebsiella pneumoniae]